ncbi:MAG: ABC transporter permease [Gemmatimonadota bacterium]
MKTHDHARRARLYRLMLRLLPPEAREEFGTEMLQLFLDRCREAEEAGGMTRLWFEAGWDVVRHGTAERLERAGGHMRDLWRGMTMGGWIQDVRFAARGLRRRPGFSSAAVVTLALGIGASVSIFSVVNGVLLTPLPYPEPESLVTFWSVNEERGTRSRGMAHPEVADWRALSSTFEHVAGYARARMTLTGFGLPEVVAGGRTTGDLLAVFGLNPTLGRDLTPEDDVSDGARVVVLGQGLWTERFGGDPGAVGRTVTLDGASWEVVGVAPEGFDFPGGAGYWVPFYNDPEECGRGCRIMSGIARLAGGADLERARRQVGVVSARLAEEYPDSHRYRATELERLADVVVADVETALWLLLGAVSMVLLVACANVANLLLARAVDRSAEVSLRATLGASVIRLARQLLTESFLMALLAGVAGAVLAWWGTALLMRLAPPTLLGNADIAMDESVLVFAALVVAGVTALFGLVPALYLARRAPADSLNGSRGSRGGRHTGLLRSALLSGEVALSLVLMLGAGLLFRTIGQMEAVDLGFSVSGVERFRLSLPESRYGEGPVVARFFATLEDRLTALPEVEHAGVTFGAPLESGTIGTDIVLLDRDPVPPPDRPSVAVRAVSPGYLDAAGLTLLQGRWFTEDDRRSGEPVAVIGWAAAARFYGDEDPVGKQIRLSVSWGFDEEPTRTVVGVVGDIRGRRITEDDGPAAYLPNAQFGVDVGIVTLKLRAGVATALPAARSVLATLDPNLAITNPETMEQVVSREMAATRFYMTLLAVFSGMALVLATVGLYGVVAYGVGRRTREIGIRIALGARSDDVTALMVRQGVAPALAGLCLGLLGAWMGARAMATLLYGVRPHDPATSVVATGLLFGVVMAATLLPARRAARIPPSSALRVD